MSLIVTLRKGKPTTFFMSSRNIRGINLTILYYLTEVNHKDPCGFFIYEQDSIYLIIIKNIHKRPYIRSFINNQFVLYRYSKVIFFPKGIL